MLDFEDFFFCCRCCGVGVEHPTNINAKDKTGRMNAPTHREKIWSCREKFSAYQQTLFVAWKRQKKGEGLDEVGPKSVGPTSPWSLGPRLPPQTKQKTPPKWKFRINLPAAFSEWLMCEVMINSVHTRCIVKTSGFTRGVCKNRGFC